VFGIADTSFQPAKVYLKVVDDRSANTLIPIIQRVCISKTIIYSDQWRSYNRLASLGINHQNVNHSLYFVDPNTNVHTQNIESYWSKIKLRIKMSKDIIKNNMKLFLNKSIFKDNISQNDFSIILDLIKSYY
jgi:transposase-like protein